MFARKKAAKESKEDTPPNKPRKGDALMAQLGIGSNFGEMEDMIYGDDDDDDLEAELAALQNDSSPEAKPRPKPKPMNLEDIEKFAMKDIDGDDDDDDDISESEEPGLLAELNLLSDDRDDDSKKDDKKTPPSASDMAIMVEDRLAMYQIAIQNANKIGDTNKERRLTRGVKTLEDMLKVCRSGKQIDPDDLPPPVTLGSSPGPSTTTMPPTAMKQNAPPPPRDKSPNYALNQPMPHSHPPPTSPRVQPAQRPIPAIPSSKPKIELAKPTSTDPNYVPGCEFVEEKDKETHAMLFHRRSQYKQAALVAKRAGDVALATNHIRTAKQFDAVILALEEGKPVDLSKMPPPPPSPTSHQLPSLGVAAQVSVKTEVQSRADAVAAGQGTSTEPSIPETDAKDLFNAPDAPTTVLEALKQRLNKYVTAEDEAKKEGNSSKARRMGRIVKQYTDSIKAYEAGRPIDYESLPTPPGFGPIPLPAQGSSATLPAPSTSVPIAKVQPQPSHPQAPVTVPTQQATAPPKQSPAPPKRPQPGTSAAPQGTQHAHTLPARMDPQKQAELQKITSAKKNTSMRQEQHLAFLRERMREFKVAAIKAKKNDDIELAKKYYRNAKGCEPMIQAAEAGLPVDLSQVPEAPSLDDDDERFVVVSADECTISGDREEMYKSLEQSLLQQIRTSVTNAQHYTKIGDIPMASKFKKFEQNSRKDLDSLKSGHTHGDPVPKFHYETRTFSMVKCNTDIGENDLELTVIRGIQYNPPTGYSPEDMTTYVKYEFPFPTDEIQTGTTESSKRSCDPEYNETFKLQINKKSRAFARVCERKGIKIEVFYKRGFLKSDKLLGTVTILLQPLETVSTLHNSYNLMDGKKAIGGKLEVKVRVRDALKNRQVEEVKEKWLVIDTFLKTSDPKVAVFPTPSAVSAPMAKKSKSDGSTSIEVMKFEKMQLDRQLSYLKDSLSQSQLLSLNEKSKQIQDKIEKQQKSLKDGGIPALKAYAAQVERELQPYEDEARVLAKQGDMQKAQLLLSKKREASKELNAINAKLKIMS